MTRTSDTSPVDGTSDTSPVEVLTRTRTHLWASAMLFFVVGDVVTTSVGLGLDQIVELGPLVGLILARYGIAAMVVVKVAVVGACYLAYCRVPDPHDTGIPLGLAVLGVLVTAWNLALLSMVVVK